MSNLFKVPSLDYTSRDYQSIINDTIARINFYVEEWTDHNPTDPGIVILQLFAGMHDVLHWYIDRGMKENFITDVLGRRSIIALAALVGQNLKGKAPAVALLDVTLQAAQLNPTPIPTGTQFGTAGVDPSKTFESTQAVTIPAGALTVSGVPVIEGVKKSGTLGTSDGNPYQSFEIKTNENVLDEGIVVKVNSIAWTYIKSLVLAGPDDEVWSYARDETGRVFIVFGNGTANGGTGKIPPLSDVVTAEWREGGGRDTNVPKNTIRTVISTLYSGGTPVSASCTNPATAEGGDEQESVLLARRRIPRAYRSNDRAVIAQDLEAIAEGVPGVVQALALVTSLGHWTVYICPQPQVGYGTGVDPYGYAVLSTLELSQTALANVVTEALAEKLCGTDSATAQIVSFRPIDTTLTLTLKEGANRADVENDFVQFVANYFNVQTNFIGRPNRLIGDAQYSDWVGGIDDLDGVDYVEVPRFQLRPMVETLAAIGTPVFSTITYTIATLDAYWEIMFISPTAYAVYRQDILSDERILQDTIGAIGTTYVAANNEIQFLVSVPSGGVEPKAGDRFRFRASPIAGSVRILTGEMMAQGNINYNIVGGV